MLPTRHGAAGCSLSLRAPLPNLGLPPQLPVPLDFPRTGLGRAAVEIPHLPGAAGAAPPRQPEGCPGPGRAAPVPAAWRAARALTLQKPS